MERLNLDKPFNLYTNHPFSFVKFSIITIFGIVSGSSGASLSVGVMFIIGLASLCADAISM